MQGPGRRCPLSYRYAPESLRRPVDLNAETLYVAGGLYGNEQALDAILRLAAEEAHPVSIVFNGDFNWFNADDEAFLKVNGRVLAHAATRGNVETELAHGDEGAGCGCAYPDEVSDVEVARSNTIMDDLRVVAARHPHLAARVAALPMTLVARVGETRVGIVHGDAESLSGWSFGVKALSTAAGYAHANNSMARAGLDVFASSHTCLPLLRELRSGVLINNGAAGMPNFRQRRHGLISRISLHPARHDLRMYGTRVRDTHVDAIMLDYGHDNFLQSFLRRWPDGSAAHQSYFRRITEGPEYAMADASGDAALAERNVCAA
jgi:predicted phosphodiesterase